MRDSNVIRHSSPAIRSRRSALRRAQSALRIPTSAILACAALVLVAPRPAVAQAREHGYVGAGVTGDWLRLSHNTESGVSTDPGASTSAVGVLFRAGAVLGRRWGVEAEFVRDRETREELQYPPIRILGASGPLATTIAAVAPEIIPIRYDQVVRQREATFSTSAWYRRRLGWRTGVVFSAGLAVAHVTRITRFAPVPLGIRIPVIAQVIAPPETRVVSIGVGPTVGADLRVRVIRHLEVTGGGRLLGVEVQGRRGVIIRASAGANWRF